MNKQLSSNHFCGNVHTFHTYLFLTLSSNYKILAQFWHDSFHIKHCGGPRQWVLRHENQYFYLILCYIKYKRLALSRLAFLSSKTCSVTSVICWPIGTQALFQTWWNDGIAAARRNYEATATILLRSWVFLNVCLHFRKSFSNSAFLMTSYMPLKTKVMIGQEE